MAFEIRPDSGNAFSNKKKTEISHPDFTGDCLIDGKAWTISVWKKKTKAGDTFLSFGFKPPFKSGEKVTLKQASYDSGWDTPF